MKTYIKEIPGKAHLNEDSHYSSVFDDAQGKNCGLFCIADGLSGFKGTTASHLALKIIRDYLEPEIRKGKNTDYPALIQKAVLSACTELDGLTGARTTLDLALVSQDKLYLAHLGDSRTYLIYDAHCQQITRDEDQAGIPTNFIGAYRIESVSLEDRINFASSEAQEKTALKRMRSYQKIESLPRFIFMTTDGLVARATEQEIKEILLNCGKYDDPGQALEKFSQIVCSPRQRLLSEERGYNGTLRRKILYDVKDFKVEEGISDEELVERILEGYFSGASEELCRKLDGFLKFDDTTMVLVDLEDSVGRKLERLKKLEAETIPGLEEYKEKYSSLEEENKSLKTSNEELDASLKHCSKELEARTKKLEDKVEEFQAFKQEHDGVLKRFWTSLNKKPANKKHKYQTKIGCK